MRTLTGLTLGLALLLPAAPAIAERPPMTLEKHPQCGCCNAWARYVERAGFDVTIRFETDGEARWLRNRIPAGARSCHTALVDGYVIEGHVPLEDIERLLAERPDAIGLAVAGMPMGSPGMEGAFAQAYDVLLLERDGSTRVYRRVDPDTI